MKKSLFAILVGLGVGYVLGARAGRERYDLIVEKVSGVWEDPRVAKARHEAARYAREQAHEAAQYAREQAPVLRDRAQVVGEKAQAAAKAAPGLIADRAKDVAAAAKDAAKDVADRTVATTRRVTDRTTSAATSAATTAANRVGEARDAALENDEDDEAQQL